ncbi:MAG: CaiB/BaiF CoA-transferase family protein [Pseudomonadota bacterium]|nr:CaiB/BaiF CoA-transferase family protein [Pseudomonadota bacterium]
MGSPLDGILVLDFSTLLPGPMAGLVLAEAGAEVIKIERPGAGEDMRHYQPRWGESSASFNLLNRGKKSLALNLKDERDKAKLQPLADNADVIIEQFRPGVMARLGLDYGTVKATNPGIVYCSITGYGQTGSKRDAAGHDLNYLGDTGLLSQSMGTAESPVLPPALFGDIAGGAYPAVMNILLALRERDRSGEGAYLDISMSDNLFPFLFWTLGNGQAAEQWSGNGDGLFTGGSPRYRIYATADGKFIAVAALEQKFWEAFTDVIGLEPGLRHDEKNPAATIAGVATLIAGQTGDHWAPLFAAADCCASVIRTVQEALDDPHFRARGLFDAAVINNEGDEMPALPVPVARSLRAIPDGPRGAPALGAHNGDLI